MKFDAIHAHISKLYNAGLRPTFCLEGPPGIGKTELASELAADLDFDSFVPIPASCIDPIDPGGVPAILTDEVRGLYATRVPLDDLIPTERCLLLIDDLGAALQATKLALFRVVWERRVGRVSLHPDTLIICTTNRMNDKAGVQAMPTPLVNKMAWLRMEPPTVQEWSIAMSARGTVNAIVVGYLHHAAPRQSTTGEQMTALMDFDPLVPGPFGSPRSWEELSKDANAYAPEPLPPLDAVIGRVGEGRALELQGFAQVASQLVSPDVILMEPERAPVPDDPSALYVVSTGLAARAAGSNFDRLMVYLLRCPGEFQIFTVKSGLATQRGRLARMEPAERKRTKLIEHTAGFSHFAAENQDLLI